MALPRHGRSAKKDHSVKFKTRLDPKRSENVVELGATPKAAKRLVCINVNLCISKRGSGYRFCRRYQRHQCWSKTRSCRSSTNNTQTLYGTIELKCKVR